MPSPFDTPATDASGEPTTVGSYRGFEVYPMPAFVSLEVPDLAAAIAWYDAALGFQPMFVLRDPDGAPRLAHLRRRKYQDLMLVPGAGGPGAGVTITFRGDDPPEDIAARARAAPPTGASAVEGPIETPWNTTDVRVTDPAGHRLVLTGPSRQASPEAFAAWQARFDAAADE